MTEKKTTFTGRIPASQLPPVKTWHLPRVQAGHVVRSPFQEKQRKSQPQTAVSEEAEVEPLTVEAIERIRQQAHDEGFQQGQQAGMEQGLNEGRVKGEQLGQQTGLKRAEAEINALKAKLNGMMTTLNRPLQKQQNELEASLLRLVLDTAKTVVKSELATRPELLQSAIQEALRSLPHADQGLYFLVSPDDLELLELIREREQSDWVLKTDESLAPGSVVIKGQHSFLEYSVEGRFTQVVQSLLEECDLPDSAVGSDESAGEA